MLTQLLGAGAGLLGGLLNKGATGKRTKALNDILNGQTQDYQLGRDTVFGTGNGTPGLYSEVSGPAIEQINRMVQAMYGGDQGGLFGSAQSQNANLFDPNNLKQSILGGNIDPYGQNTPGLQDNMAQLQALYGKQGNQNDFASGIFQGGGNTDFSNTAYGRLDPYTQGQSLPQQGLTNMANNIFGSNGESQNPLSSTFRNYAAQKMSGTNPDLQNAIGQAFGISSAGGQTGPTNQGIQKGMEVLGQNGQTGTTQGLQNRGLDLFNQPSLLPPDLAATMAHDQAATAYSQNMEAAQRQAQSRGGGPGATVANGLQNKGMADYADQGSQIEAQAMRDSLMKQQGLQLQQAGMGAGAAGQGSQLQNTRFGQGGNLLDSMASLQSQRQLGSLGMIPGLNQQGINQASAYGGMGLASQGQNMDAVKAGAGMYNDVNSSSLQGQDLWNRIMQTTNNYGLGAGQLANQGAGHQLDIGNSMLGGNFTAANQGLGRTNSFYQQGQQGISNNLGLLNFSGNQFSNSLGQGNQTLNDILNWTTGQGNAANQTRYQNLPSATSPWGNFLGAVGGTLMGGGAGNIFGGGGGKNGGNTNDGTQD